MLSGKDSESVVVDAIKKEFDKCVTEASSLVPEQFVERVRDYLVTSGLRDRIETAVEKVTELKDQLDERIRKTRGCSRKQNERIKK